MFQPDMVLTSAIEVGIAIAGFTGIVIALSGDGRSDPALRLLVSILLLASIASVFFAFLPMLLSIAKLEESLVWALSSGAFLVYILAVIVHRLRQMRSQGLQLDSPMAVGGPLFVAALLLQLANVLLLREAWPYMVLIVCYVLYAFSVFVTLLWRIWKVKEASSEG